MKIKFFYLLQKNIKLNKNICNISVLINISMNLYDNSNIDGNKKNRNKLYDLYKKNLFIVINIKIIFSLITINRVILLLIHVDN